MATAEIKFSTADDAISVNEMARLERQWSELVAAGQLMMRHLRARHESARPASSGSLKAA